jgi:DNA-binding response OmpR family regulator
MDKKSGFQVADEIKKSAELPDIPIVAMTGFYTEKEHSILMNVCGIRTCLIKPFNPLDVINKIEQIIER